MSESLDERIARIAAERARIEREQAELRVHAEQELGEIAAQIEKLQKRKDHLEAFLGVATETTERARRGEIIQVCLEVLKRHPDGLTSREVAEVVAKERPGTPTTSIPATLSRQLELGNVTRDNLGRYKLP